jgi:hypothetical protein
MPYYSHGDQHRLRQGSGQSKNKLKNLKGKTYREWSQRLELWKREFMDQGGKW